MGEEHRFGRDDLERLYQRYGGLVHRRARRLLGDDQLARDVCHDVFVQVIRSEPWAPASPAGWLYTTTTNLCLNVLRGARRQRRAFRLLGGADAVASPATPATLLLRRIPPALQEIAVYYAVDQMTQDEIAAVLAVSQKTVSNRLQELRMLLDEETAPAREAR
jgi:DNA-directed RNA polymerase specialized sigma24 family protein